ncbi:hypothetical protein HNR60_000788 [Rhodopseudomonas rhenobacensis]|uniref:Uncharacterized protein n=1 Tax=Rhodopseudomonas rhenobacensis TaxID=87461 RepID=A0A7W7Z131_9BRAD|nr:hypothetical protein [Rhodopseudomonas rhenobacensis]MBB5046046.1 hypothetical protein [Rhodopseudomonas rhenobacensis]
MKSLATIRRLLAILMIAGLAMAPLSRPAMAEASTHGAMQAGMMMAAEQAVAVDAHHMSAVEMAADTAMASIEMASAEMASEMPCCPSQAPAPSGCDKCVAMISCMSSGFVAMPIALLQPAFVLPGNALPRHTDARADGMGHSPPEYPPRTLV